MTNFAYKTAQNVDEASKQRALTFINNNRANLHADTNQHFVELVQQVYPAVSEAAWDFVAVLAYEDETGCCIAFYDEELELGYIEPREQTK